MSLPILPFLAPPAARGTGGRKAGGFTASGLTNTELGDRVERAIAEQLAVASALPDNRRQGAFDLEDGDLVFEVKACTVEATEFKMKPKKAEVERKLAAAKKRRATPASVIAVVDGSRALVYWRLGIGAFRLTPDWHFAGEVEL